MSVGKQGSLERAVLGGLAVGLLAGAFLLAYHAFTSGVDCTELTFQECALAQETTRSVARLQAFAGTALALLSAACFLYLRAKSRTT
ncbi:MAG: hypothetical protein ACOZIN_12675 [Myxococcota bacterium]